MCRAYFRYLGVYVLLLVNFSNMQGQEKKMAVLDAEEAAALRRAVATKGLVTSHVASKTGFPCRILVVPDELVKLHNKNRLAVLQLLLEIVRDAKAREALSAVAFAVALEENSTSAACYVDLLSNDNDEKWQANGARRKRIVACLEEMVLKANTK